MDELFPRSKYAHLLEDAAFRSWIENLERGSELTAEVALRRMGHICSGLSATPPKLARLPKRQAGEFLLNAVSFLEKEGNKGSTIAGYVKSLRSWWRFNDLEVTKPVRLRHDDGLYDNERMPSAAELHSIFEHADLQKKVSCALMAFAGFRPQVLGNRDSNDGLRVSDFPEMLIKPNGRIEFLKVPTIIVVRRSVSKTRNQYISFLPEQGCTYVAEYLGWRARVLHEELRSDSPIVTANPTNRAYLGKHVRTNNIGDAVRVALRSAGFGWRPYVLLRYFDTRMMGAEQEGLIIKDFRVFWMGHKGDIEHVYTLNKGQLPQDQLEKMREAFASATEKYLVTTRREAMSQDAILATINRKFLELAGYASEEIDGMGDLSSLSAEEMKELLRQKDRERLGLDGNRQRVVPMSEAKKMIEDGWEFITQLPDNECIVKLPA